MDPTTTELLRQCDQVQTVAAQIDALAARSNPRDRVSSASWPACGSRRQYRRSWPCLEFEDR